MPNLNSAYVPHLGREMVFQDRSTMRTPFVGRSFRMPQRGTWTPPATQLPVDSTGDAKVQCPILGNDRYGICGPAMLAHRLQILKFRQGKGAQLNINLNALVSQYFSVAGGDNGIGEPQAIDILKAGVAGDTTDVFVDALDIDVTDHDLVDYAIDQCYTVQMGFSVPDRFRSGFAPGSVWASALRPNPRLGHYVPLADIAGPATPVPDTQDPTGGGRTPYKAADDPHWLDDEGPRPDDGCPRAFAAGGGQLTRFRRLWTWGSWCWVSPAFVENNDPDGFVVFSTAVFDAQGLDSKGRHIANQAKIWEAAGGNPIPASLLAKYPDPDSPLNLNNWA